jgi:hypothetical protein
MGLSRNECYCRCRHMPCYKVRPVCTVKQPIRNFCCHACMRCSSPYAVLFGACRAATWVEPTLGAGLGNSNSRTKVCAMQPSLSILPPCASVLLQYSSRDCIKLLRLPWVLLLILTSAKAQCWVGVCYMMQNLGEPASHCHACVRCNKTRMLCCLVPFADTPLGRSLGQQQQQNQGLCNATLPFPPPPSALQFVLFQYPSKSAVLLQYSSREPS